MTLCEQLELATLECVKRAQPLLLRHGRKLPGIQVRCDLRGRAAGQARLGDRLEIRYNLAIAASQPEAFLRETVPHEVAHLVTWLLHGRTARPHGTEWKAIMRHLGVQQPQRCHDFDAPAARQQRRWPYRCGCTSHQLSTTRHRRILNGVRYRCGNCGQELLAGETEQPDKETG